MILARDCEFYLEIFSASLISVLRVPYFTKTISLLQYLCAKLLYEEKRRHLLIRRNTICCCKVQHSQKTLALLIYLLGSLMTKSAGLRTCLHLLASDLYL